MADPFISAEKFQIETAIRKENNKVLYWVELPKDKIYRVSELEVIHTSRLKKKCLIAHFVDKSDEAVKVWIGKIKTQIKIASLGLEKNSKIVTNCFDLCYTDIAKV